MFPTIETAGSYAKSPVAALARWSKTGDVLAEELKDLTEKIDKLNGRPGEVHGRRPLPPAPPSRHRPLAGPQPHPLIQRPRHPGRSHSKRWAGPRVGGTDTA